jgi:hypothetical protein
VQGATDILDQASSHRGESRRWAGTIVGLLILLVACAIGSAHASAEPPALPGYEGGMSFPDIHGPSDPEQFSWQVHLQDGQELVAIDDQHAVVYYEGREHTALGIGAAPARDAVGSAVPTSLIVSDGNIVTLVVHHRDGNPAADGAPFRYPITAGPGFEVGFSTVTVVMPPPEDLLEGTVLSSPVGCVVPRVSGQSLKAARKNLNRAGCKLGNVRGRRSKTARVVKQDLRPGTAVATGTEVGVKLGE